MLAKHTLYQLSYIPQINQFLRTMRVELILSAWKAENLPLIYIRNTTFIAKKDKLYS